MSDAMQPGLIRRMFFTPLPNPLGRFVPARVDINARIEAAGLPTPVASLYSVGTGLNDNGGARPPVEYQWAVAEWNATKRTVSMVLDFDWILFPPAGVVLKTPEQEAEEDGATLADDSDTGRSL